MKKLVIVLVIALIAIGVVGYQRQWFHVSVDEQKIKSDAELAKTKAAEFEAKAEKLAGIGGDKPAVEVQGQIKLMEPTEHRFTLKTGDDKEVVIYFDAATTVSRDNKPAKTNALRFGDKAAVKYVTKDDKNVAQSVTVHK